MTLTQQLVAVARLVPGFILGAPTRWLARVHAPVDIDGEAFCLRHRAAVAWPCREALDAADALAKHPEWRP